MESLKNARITITHVYFSALTFAMSLGRSLNHWPDGLVFKQVPLATANVNACMIPIFDYDEDFIDAFMNHGD